LNTSPRKQLRPTVYLYRGLDDVLMVALEQTPRRRRSMRLMELIDQGLNAEALERANALGSIYVAVVSELPTRAKIAVALRINHPTNTALYDLVASARNQTDRLRSLAAKGLRREARLHQGTASHIVAEPQNEERPAGLAKRLMASMVATLQKGDAL
jgi:hypothetical protein